MIKPVSVYQLSCWSIIKLISDTEGVCQSSDAGCSSTTSETETTATTQIQSNPPETDEFIVVPGIVSLKEKMVIVGQQYLQKEWEVHHPEMLLFCHDLKALPKM